MLAKKNPIVGPRVTVESVTVINLFYLDNHTRQHHAQGHQNREAQQDPGLTII